MPNHSLEYSPWRLSVAPMLDWTDKHYRFMARQISKHTRLYSEMIHANALIFGDTDRFLNHHTSEAPLALQLGGSDADKLAQCTKIAWEYGYDEVNLNCGCPSERVQKGSFGACLMHETTLVADCLNAMQNAADIHVTVKHRIGIDQENNYSFVRDFVGELAEKTACKVFIVHARNAWLQGLSPKENREIPPLKYHFVYQLKKDFPQLHIVINGGIVNNQQITEHLQHVDGVMVGREAYHNPMIMSNWDQIFFNDKHPAITYEALIHRLYDYAQECDEHASIRDLCRHYLGIMHGQKNARIWRRMLSDSNLLRQNDASLILQAYTAISTEKDKE